MQNPMALEPTLFNFPCLPQGMTLSHVIELVERNARRIQLGPARREVLLRLIRKTSPGDWTASDRDPVCFCAQQDLAHELGITDRALRNHEQGLAASGLLEIDTAANGRRSGRLLSNGRRLGINLRPLILMLPRLIELDAAWREEARRCQVLRLECSAAKRDVKRLIEHLLTTDPTNPALASLLHRRSAWPRRYSTMVDAGGLSDHLAEIEALRAECAALLHCAPKPSGRAAARLPAIGNTNPNLSESCNGAERQGEIEPTCEAENALAAPKPARERAGGAASADDLSWLTPETLRDLAGPDLRYYLDSLCPGDLPCPRSLRSAVFHLLPELQIGEEVMNAAASVFGDFAASLVVLVIDANRDHPVHPIRCPGAALRCFTRLQEQGAFNLADSLIGLRARREAAG